MADLLVPAVNTLKSYIKCVASFQDPNLLNSITLNSSLNDLIISCFQIFVCQDILQKLVQFQCLYSQNKKPLATFHFIAESLNVLTSTFTSYPMEFEETLPIASVSVKYVSVAQKPGQHTQNRSAARKGTNKLQCGLCTFKNF